MTGVNEHLSVLLSLVAKDYNGYANLVNMMVCLGAAMRRGSSLAGLQEHFAAVAHVVLRTIHVILQVSIRQLRLDHPELRQVARRVAVLRPARVTPHQQAPNHLRSFQTA